jgi:glycerol-3-phosphate acyltransferase PlsY
MYILPATCVRRLEEKVGMEYLALALTTLVAYAIGALPVGVLIADYHKVDISLHGSGKTGTTNVLRTIGRRAAALVLLGDVIKGVVAVLVARLFVGTMVLPGEQLELFGWQVAYSTTANLLAAVAAVIGHVWSVYLRLLQGKWNGGRGVATAIGAILVVNPLIVLAAVVVGLPTMIISRYVSLGSMLGAVSGGLVLIVLVATGQMDYLSILFLFVPVFIVASHKDNIERLLKGTERKLGDKARV